MGRGIQNRHECEWTESLPVVREYRAIRKESEMRPFRLAVGLLHSPLLGLVMSHSKFSQWVVRRWLGEWAEWLVESGGCTVAGIRMA